MTGPYDPPIDCEQPNSDEVPDSRPGKGGQLLRRVFVHALTILGCSQTMYLLHSLTTSTKTPSYLKRSVHAEPWRRQPLVARLRHSLIFPLAEQ